MENLIKNSDWQEESNGGPKYFSGAGPTTYDKPSINGARTCSVTLLNNNKDNSFAADFYDPSIDVRGQNCINWGYTIRVIDADSIMILAKFYGPNNELITTVKSNITNTVTYDFKRVSANFPIPQNANTVMLSMEFKGAITACSYCRPEAYFC